MTLHLHIGAHKTATTHLQATLIRHSARLAQAGVQFVPPDEIRALASPGRRASVTMGPLPSLRRAAAVRKLARLDSGAERMLISDENCIGHCAEIFERELIYPTLLRRLQIWRRLCDRRETVIYLSVRNYAPFLSAAYVQMIRKAPFFSASETSLQTLAAMTRRWTDVIADVRRALPAARLKVWAFEDYVALGPRLYQEMSGLSLPPVQRQPMATPSQAAMEAFLSAPKRKTLALHDFAYDHPITPENPKFSLWTAEQTAAMTETYLNDLDTLCSDLREDFLLP